jgi:DNA-binding NarL/FixJ family response regulator
MTSNKHISIVLADDHPIFRKGLRQVIESAESLEVVGEAGDGESALRLIHELKPCVAILDIEMPGKDGFDVAAALRHQDVPTAIVFLTMHRDETVSNKAMEAGVRGYLLKDNASDDLLECIDAVARGNCYFSSSISNYFAKQQERIHTLIHEHPSLSQLTPTERSVIHLVAENKTSREIGDELHINVKTVEKHRVNIARKLNLHGNHSLLSFALEPKGEL